MKPEALKVATDILRELGMEDVARWVEHPDAVRLLLATTPLGYDGDNCADVSCRQQAYDAHLACCSIAAAWRALEDPRGQADIERAHEEAHAANRCQVMDDQHIDRCELPRGHTGRHCMDGHHAEARRVARRDAARWRG